MWFLFTIGTNTTRDFYSTNVHNNVIIYNDAIYNNIDYYINYNVNYNIDYNFDNDIDHDIDDDIDSDIDISRSCSNSW